MGRSNLRLHMELVTTVDNWGSVLWRLLPAVMWRTPGDHLQRGVFAHRLLYLIGQRGVFAHRLGCSQLVNSLALEVLLMCRMAGRISANTLGRAQGLRGAAEVLSDCLWAQTVAATTARAKRMGPKDARREQ